jgi:aminocarboxymuconate-semialdehyde decarboxylase
MTHNGVLERYTEVKVILSHAGGFLPYASHRFAELLSALHPDGPTADELLALFGKFYFDTALSAGPAALPSLLAFAGDDHVLYGSDFPYAPASVGASFTAKLDAFSALDEGQHASINNGTGKRLFARLAG